jgi:uncharacterized Rmd1/YagE family protein
MIYTSQNNSSEVIHSHTIAAAVRLNAFRTRTSCMWFSCTWPANLQGKGRQSKRRRRRATPRMVGAGDKSACTTPTRLRALLAP